MKGRKKNLLARGMGVTSSYRWCRIWGHAEAPIRVRLGCTSVLYELQAVLLATVKEIMDSSVI